MHTAQQLWCAPVEWLVFPVCTAIRILRVLFLQVNRAVLVIRSALSHWNLPKTGSETVFKRVGVNKSGIRWQVINLCKLLRCATSNLGTTHFSPLARRGGSIFIIEACLFAALPSLARGLYRYSLFLCGKQPTAHRTTPFFENFFL